MISALGNLLSYVTAYGILHGTRLWIQLKFKAGNFNNIKVPGIAHHIKLRPISEDIYTFWEIFIDKAYALEWPKDRIAPRTILDAGANIGLTSIFLANQFPEARILAVEPESANFSILQQNAANYPNIIPVCAAIWPTSERVGVHDKGLGRRAFTIEAHGDTGIAGIAIGDLMEEHNISYIDLLKIDIEGSEKEIFESSDTEWLDHVGVLVIELHDRMKPGCSRAFFSKISDYEHSCEIIGENLMFVLK